jgi:hypothetical protein
VQSCGEGEGLPQHSQQPGIYIDLMCALAVHFYNINIWGLAIVQAHRQPIILFSWLFILSFIFSLISSNFFFVIIFYFLILWGIEVKDIVSDVDTVGSVLYKR